MDTSLALDTLPTELIQHIAHHLPVRSILRLCRVNRRLRATCYDRTVFKRIACDAIYEESDDSFSYGQDVERAAERKAWYLSWPEASLLDRLSAADSARVAVAIEKANYWVTAKHGNDIGDWRKRWVKASFSNWVPQLIALRHLSGLRIKPERLQLLLWVSGESMAFDLMRNPYKGDFITAGFAMTALMLMRIDTMRFGVSDAVDIQQPFVAIYSDYNAIEDMEWMLGDIHVSGGFDGFDFTDRYLITLYLLFKAYPSQAAQKPHFPSLYYIPLASLLDYPVPFRTPASSFAKCHLSVQALVGYLAGRWKGWTTDTRRLSGSLVAPIRNMQLVVREVDADCVLDAAVVIDEESQGMDNLGPFKYSGHATTDGEVYMNKTYLVEAGNTRGPYRLKGVVTPFGISGTWTLNRDNGTIGYFWFWKDEWCRD
jgi:hypothetical protein